LILLTMSLNNSRILSSVSSLCFFSDYTISTRRWPSSLIRFTSVLSNSSLSFDSFLISSWSFGKSFSRQLSKCSMFSYLLFDSLAISDLRAPTL
jgi:hypothetical protein